METYKPQIGSRVDTIDSIVWPEKIAFSLSKIVYPICRAFNTIGVALLAVMMLLTVTDVSLRYFFNLPIMGSLELTKFLMLVLVSFGIANAGVKKEHISVDFISEKLSLRTKAAVNTVTTFLTLCLFILITWSCIVYAERLLNAHDVSESLLIPKYPFAYIVSLGAALFCLVLICNFFEYLAQAVKHNSKWLVWGLPAIAVLVAILASVPTWYRISIEQVTPVMAGLIGVLLVLLLMSTGMPIGITMALPGFLGIVYLSKLGAGFSILATTLYSEFGSYLMSQVPLFLLMGFLCFYSKLSEDLYNTAYRWLGHLRGGLAMASVAACTAFGAVSGSHIAEVATMAKVVLPELKKYGYNAKIATAALAVGGGIGSLIPPSTMMVIYAMLTEVSISKIYLAGIIPGILQAILYIFTIYFICRRDPLLGPPGEISSFKERFISVKGVWAVVGLFILVIGGMYFGVFTPTEAGGIGAFGALLFAITKRQLTWKKFVDSLFESGNTTSAVMLMLIGAMICNYFIALTQLPSTVSKYIATLSLNRYFIWALIMVFYMTIGTFLSAMAMVLLTIPILFPVMVTLGFDPIWFGIQLIILCELANITPPYALNIFIIQGIAKDVNSGTIYRGVTPFLIAACFEIVLLTAFPAIVTFLPSTMK